MFLEYEDSKEFIKKWCRVDINFRRINIKCQLFKVPFFTLLGNHELKTETDNKEVLKLIGYENAVLHLQIMMNDV